MATITYYAWTEGATVIYTLNNPPSVGENVYSDTSGTVFGTVRSADSSEIILNGSPRFFERDASKDVTVSTDPDNIADAIAAAQDRVANAYTAISAKGGTLPATQNLANMPTAISSIPSGGTIDSLTITPTTSQQTITASGGVNGYSPITVNAVTSSIDANITAGNIKSGVSILGVSGSLTELKGESRSVSLTNKNGQTFTPSSGKNGITSITVTPNNQAKTITPTTSQQSISVPSGYSGFGTLTVNAVTSSIDANITAGNIKKDVQILGVTGTYEGSSSATTPRFLKCTLTNSDFEVDDYGDLDSSEVDDFVSTLAINVILDLETTEYGRILWLPDLQSIEEVPGDLFTVFENKCYCNGYSDNVDTSRVLVGYEDGLDSYFTLYMTIDGIYFFKNTSVPYLAEGTVLSIRSGTMVDQDGYPFSPFTIRLTTNKVFTPAT